MATRILYVITKANWGGAQRYVYDLTLAARKAGHDVSVAFGSDGHLQERLEAAHVRTISIRSLARDVRFGRDLTAFRELMRMIKQERPDVIHINSTKAGGLGALAARARGVSHIIFTAHGWAFNENRPWWQKTLMRLLAAVTVLLSHKTICVSEAIRHDIAWVPFAKSKLVVIHHGIKCESLKTREEARDALLPRQEHRFWIGMLSELHPTKCVIDAIFAFAHLAKKHSDAILVILGEGEERARLERAIRALDLSERVFLLGFIPEGASYLPAFDLFLHAAHSEALGYAILEAGCAGVPVVATRVGGIPEIIPDDSFGLLVEPHRSGQLTAAIESLMHDRQRADELGKNLQKRVDVRFSKQKMLADTLRLYER